MEMLQVPAGSRPPRPPNSSPSFISTPTHARLLAEMMQSHLVKDMCLIGAKVHKQLPEPQQTGLHTSTELLTTELMCVWLQEQYREQYPTSLLKWLGRFLVPCRARVCLAECVSKSLSFTECLIIVISSSWWINMFTYILMCFSFVSLQGCGKSVIAKEFAEMLGYSIEPIMLYQV